MSSFGWPEAWPVLLLAPLAWLGLRFVERARARRLRDLVGPRAGTLAAELDTRRRGVRRILFVAGLLCALVAVVQPLFGVDARRFEQRGVDILVCLDVSRSMLAQDVAPSRLARAKDEIRALTDRTRGDRMGLVVFSGEARLVVPLTQDMESFADLVDQADPLAVGLGGTDLGAALDTSLGALEGASGDHEVVLLITDGEDLEGRGMRAATACAERGVTVHCVGFGSILGSKIVTDAGGAGEAFLRDRSGEEVVTVMDPAALRAIAESTGGRFVEASAAPRPLVALYEEQVLPMARKAFGSDPRDGRANRFQVPLLAAFVLWLLELATTDRRPR